jgi:hypothetical protein
MSDIDFLPQWYRKKHLARARLAIVCTAAVLALITVAILTII